MPLWSSSLRTGDPVLDAHHAELLGLLDQALSAVERRDVPQVAERLERFDALCRAHHDAERRELHLLDPGAARAHLDSHAEFLGDLDRLRAELARRGLSTLFRLWLGGRLVEWFRFHTRTMDAELVEARRAAATAWREGRAAGVLLQGPWGQ